MVGGEVTATARWWRQVEGKGEYEGEGDPAAEDGRSARMDGSPLGVLCFACLVSSA